MPTLDSHPTGSPRAIRPLTVLGVWCIAYVGGCLARAPYLSAQFAFDDLDYLCQMGLVASDKWSLLRYGLTPHGPQPMILWKLLLYGEWIVVGLNTVWYHLVVNVVHSLSAVALFLLLDRYTTHRASAWVGALLWGGAGIGGWDNPLQWILCGTIALAMMWLLFAMVCVSRFHNPRSRWWAAGMALCMALAMCSWGNIVVLVPVLPLQYLLLERRGGTPRALVGVWLFWWLITLILIGGLQVALFLPHANAPDRQREFSPVEIVSRSLQQLSITLATLTYGNVVPLREQSLVPKEILATVTGLLALIFCRGPRLRLLLVWSLLIAVFLAMVNARGASIGISAAMTSGRYFYYATLFWCVAAAALFDAIADRIPLRSARHRPLVTATLAGLFAVFIWHQHTVAATARGYHDTVAAQAIEQVDTQQRLLKEFVKAGGHTLPDLPVLVENPSHLLSLTSGFAAISRIPDVGPRRTVPVDLLPEHDAQAAIAAVGRLAAPGAKQWSDVLARSYADFAALAWLSNLAVEKKIVVRLPRSWYKYGDITFPVEQCLAWGFSRPLPGIVAVDPKQITAAEWRELQKHCLPSNDPRAHYWINLMQRVVP